MSVGHVPRAGVSMHVDSLAWHGASSTYSDFGESHGPGVSCTLSNGGWAVCSHGIQLPGGDGAVPFIPGRLMEL